MNLKVNNKDFEVPFDPMVITLGDYVRYQNEFGEELDRELEEIIKFKFEDESDREAAFEDHVDKEALSWFSFWTKLDFFEAKEIPAILPVLEQYRVLRVLFKKAEDVDFPYEIEWNGEIWEIGDFKVNPANEMSFNELITSKEVMRQVRKLGKGKWIGMPYLCAVFLRKKGEKFIDAMVFEGGERLTLMQSLPLQYALFVGFFLNASVSFWNEALAYSEDRTEELSLN